MSSVRPLAGSDPIQMLASSPEADIGEGQLSGTKRPGAPKGVEKIADIMAEGISPEQFEVTIDAAQASSEEPNRDQEDGGGSCAIKAGHGSPRTCRKRMNRSPDLIEHNLVRQEQ